MRFADAELFSLPFKGWALVRLDRVPGREMSPMGDGGNTTRPGAEQCHYCAGGFHRNKQGNTKDGGGCVCEVVKHRWGEAVGHDRARL